MKRYVIATIINFVIRSIKERKARVMLIITVIMLSATLLFVSVSLSNTLIDLYRERMDQFTGIVELLITAKNNNKEISLLGIELNIKCRNLIAIYIHINEEDRKFTVVGIAQDKGIFLDESEKIYSIVPFDTLNEYLGQEDKYNVINTKTSSNIQTDKLQSEIEDEYNELKAYELFTVEEIETQVNRIATPLLLVTIIALMSVYIIYSSFKVITIEKLSIVGTFRRVGATTNKANKIFIFESLFYGVVGGILACVLGILYLIYYLSIPSEMRDIVSVDVKFSFVSLLIPMLGSILLCIVSSLIPILRISPMSIKSIIFNDVKGKHKKNNKRCILGILFVILAIILPKCVSSNLCKC